MIVFGEKPEYFNAVWLKNEWMRFKNRIEKGEKHKNSLVVVYKNMNPGDLPAVLRSRQCLNAADMTFLSDLNRHIKRIVDEAKKSVHLDKIEITGGQIAKKATTLAVNTVQTREIGAGAIAETSISEQQTLSLAQTYLEASQWDEAAQLVGDVLFENPGCAEAIWYGLLAKHHVADDARLVTKFDQFRQEDFATIDKYLNCINKDMAKEKLTWLWKSLSSMQDSACCAMLNIILPYKFQTRELMIKQAFEQVIQTSKFKSFCLLLSTLNSSDVDKYIDYNYRYAQITENKDKKAECLRNVLNVDEGNVAALRDMVIFNWNARRDYPESVIKWEANNDIFVWKHPIEDFNLGSQLIVHQTQEALFFRDGRALDLFGAGRYTLETQKIPLLNELYKLPTNADVALHSEVYFVNKTVQTGIKWGTPSKVRIMEPSSNIPIEIGARGSFNLAVSDSRKLILRLVGTTSAFAQSDVNDNGEAYSVEYMRGKFADMITMNVTSLLARVITENRLNVLTIDTMKPEISRILGNAINRELGEYGLQIPDGQFYVTDVVTPEDDPNYIRLKRQYVTASLDIRDEQIEKAKIEAVGDRILAEKAVEAKINIFDAQATAATAKIDAQGAADVSRIIASGASDSTVTIAEGVAEKIKLEGKAEADAYRAQAMAEADEMKAKGYTYQDETRRKVGMEALQNGLPGTGSAGVGGAVNIGGTVNDMVGLGVTLGTVGGIVNMTKEIVNPIISDVSSVGKQIHAANGWTCTCGQTNITSKFCPECGAAKPLPVVGWNCGCGQRNITSKFCPECGAKKPEMSSVWNCSCGCRGITSKFCPECGQKREG